MLRLLATAILIGVTCLEGAAAPPNVLMIAIDDLNDWVGCLEGHPQVQTPHMDALAARGTNFTNAHCQAPLCNPSRTSVLTGLRPSTTGVYALQPGFRQVAALQDCVTLPQHFRQAGYFTAVFGKIYHDGALTPAEREREVDVWGIAPGMPRPPKKLAHDVGEHPLMDWGVFPADDREQADWKIADAAIAQLQNLPADQPFFLAAGFRLPHVPCFASQHWFDQYPEETLQLPLVKADDRSDVPAFAWNLHWKLPEPRLSRLERVGEWKSLVRAYLASTTFMDSQIGRLVAALEATGRADNTVICLWSDHGWHLGEKGITGKNTLWERSTRVPLIFAGPGVTPGSRCAEPAELLDIYPTLSDLCGIPQRGGCEGHSLRPQLEHAATPRYWPAITTHNVGNHAVRSRKWRYIRYADGSEELYDLDRDPREWTNLAADLQFAAVIADHARWLPQINQPPVPGSAHRLLVKDQNQWFWEGLPIIPSELEE